MLRPIRSASSSCPWIKSHRGLSGTLRRTSMIPSPRIAPTAKALRQPMSLASKFSLSNTIAAPRPAIAPTQDLNAPPQNHDPEPEDRADGECDAPADVLGQQVLVEQHDRRSGAGHRAHPVGAVDDQVDAAAHAGGDQLADRKS